METCQSDRSRVLELELDTLKVPARVANCLRQEGIHTVGELVALRSSDIFRWPNAGRKTLNNIRLVLGGLGVALTGENVMPVSVEAQSLSISHQPTPSKTHLSDQSRVHELKLNELDVSARAAHCLRDAGIHTVGALVALRSRDILLWPNAGRKTLADISVLLGKLGLALADEKVLPGGVYGEQVKTPPLSIDSQATSLEDELRHLVTAVASERNVRILVKLWGWNGEAPRTLDSAGKEFALTRERVRQIEKRALERLRKHRLESPLLHAAIRAMRDAVPDIKSALDAKLRDCGLSHGKFGIDSLQSAAEHVRIKWPFEYVSIGDERVVVVAGEGAKCRKAISLLRKRTSVQGCVNVLGLASELQWDEDKLTTLRRILGAMSEAEWLDDSHDWLYSAVTPRNRLYNIASKVLAVAPRVHLSELRRAISRDRRLPMCPPQRVLSAFIERRGLGVVQDSIVFASPGRGAAPATGSAEGLMLRVLDEHAPVMDGEDFAEKCVAAGMNAISFYIYRAGSPVISSLGKNVYSKVGANVPPGTVEDIVGKRKTHTRISDHGWTSAGQLWCGTELSRQIITSGGVPLPAFVAGLVQGDWQVVLPDESEHGTVTCRNVFIWSFRKPFLVLGTEPTDLATFEFNLKARQVRVKIGGPDLFEAIQGSSTTDFTQGQ